MLQNHCHPTAVQKDKRIQENRLETTINWTFRVQGKSRRRTQVGKTANFQNL